ncbi:MAG: hypothetical protein B1H11_12420 [Desulfobacteraceae bacterium 4484_190.1]|nr:MAG: hypothetical protein B1H11_12420 [Desulfobacteraceae bacterium 4484_190.1]
MKQMVNLYEIRLRQRLAVKMLESSGDNRSSDVYTQPFSVLSCADDTHFTQPNHHFAMNVLKIDTNVKNLGYEVI